MYCLCRLCCSVSCLCVNVYCTTATRCQPNCSQKIYYIIIYIPIVEDELTTLPRNVSIWLANEAASFPGRKKFVILIVAFIRVNIVVPVSWRQPVLYFTGSFVESVFLTECLSQCNDTCRQKNSRVRNSSVVVLRIHIGHRSLAFRANWVKLKTKLYVGEKAGRFYKGTYPAERYCTLMRPEATII